MTEMAIKKDFTYVSPRRFGCGELWRAIAVGLVLSRSDRHNRQLSWFNPAGVDAVLHEIEQIPFI